MTFFLIIVATYLLNWLFLRFDAALYKRCFRTPDDDIEEMAFCLLFSPFFVPLVIGYAIANSVTPKKPDSK